MSCSSLYGIKKDFTGEEIAEYRNSWWFTPIVRGVLPEKYVPSLVFTPYGFKNSIIGLQGNEIWKATNDCVNKCNSTADRVCWELSNQQIFFSKDKVCIANAIRQFLADNKSYDKSDEDGICILEREHIIERFQEIANDIENLDETEYEYFVFKNTSCDDNVEYWFSKRDEETGEYVSRPISEIKDEFIAEFVVIVNDSIKEFIDNRKFFNKLNKDLER